MIGVAIGNGTSRVGYDLESLRSVADCVTVGCNWVYRDFIPDVLVAIDSEPRKLFSSQPRDFRWLTINNSRSHVIMVEPDNSVAPVMTTTEVNGTLSKNSGIIACSYLSKILKCSKVYMVGFDFYRILPGMTNNDIYQKGLTKYYRFEEAWNKLFADCVDTEFKRIGDIPETEYDYYHNKLKGLSYMSYREFVEEVLG